MQAETLFLACMTNVSLRRPSICTLMLDAARSSGLGKKNSRVACLAEPLSQRGCVQLFVCVDGR